MTRICDAAPSERLQIVPGKLARPGVMVRAQKGAPLGIAQWPARTECDLLIRGPARRAREPELVELAHVIGVEGEAQSFAHFLQQAVGPRGEVLIFDKEDTGPLVEEFAEFGIAAAEFINVGLDGIPGIVSLAGQ